jgi:hypothetical protein
MSKKVELKDETANGTKPVLSAASFNWGSVYIQKPNEGQKVASRISNEQGYDDGAQGKEPMQPEIINTEKQSYQDKMRDKITKAKSRLK